MRHLSCAGLAMLAAANAGAQLPLPQGSSAAERAAQQASTSRIQPGDRISLRVYREVDLSDSAILVNERGEATFPKIGVVPVSRFTIGTLRDSVRARYARYLRDPDIEVVVLRRVAVSGEVRVPNVLYVEPTATLRDAIARSGGLTPDGDPKRLTVVRDGQSVRVPDWRKAEGDAFELRSGDQVVVGTKPWIVRNALGLASTAAIVISVTTAVIRGS
jgi:polysaccharide biosynthesis/export protein